MIEIKHPSRFRWVFKELVAAINANFTELAQSVGGYDGDPETIQQDATHRFVSDTEKGTWNGKQNALGFTPVADNDSRLSDARTPTAHNHDGSYSALNHNHDGAYASLGHNHNGVYSPVSHNHDGTYEPANANIQSHIGAAHAPANAQKNSDITKAEIEAKLTGEISSHTHAGATPPTVATLASDQATGANTTPVTLTGLVFSYAANSKYRIWFMGRVSPAAATTGCGFQFDLSSAVTAIDVQFFHQLASTGTLSGGHSIADDASVGVSSGLPGTGNYPVTGHGLLVTGANSGTAQLRFRSETTAVITARAGLTLVVEKIA